MIAFLICAALGLAAVAGVFLTLYLTTERALTKTRARCRKLADDLFASELERDQLAAQLARHLDATQPLPAAAVDEGLAALDRMTWTIDDGGAA
ncbi:hypothetical protein [Dactylosporangium salmoneum]|uniref:Uncharacterized protein n=1 Tax=Dactylosporangium salmoneum TaxID=53361 RepID=A0ABN3FDD2_9ACTN